MKIINLYRKYILFFLLFYTIKTQAQFVFNGQLIQRAEYRNGYGSLIQDSLSAASFISQRFRLQTEYKNKNLNIYGSIQDIRIWGNTSQIKLTDGLLSLHEGWVDLKIDSFWSIKAGRQELNYDNARFLGNLDWAMQARAHDFILVKYANKNSILHLGGGIIKMQRI